MELQEQIFILYITMQLGFAIKAFLRGFTIIGILQVILIPFSGIFTLNKRRVQYYRDKVWWFRWSKDKESPTEGW
jgi:hypothetical protein